MDISMDISMDIHIHGNPAYNAARKLRRPACICDFFVCAPHTVGSLYCNDALSQSVRLSVCPVQATVISRSSARSR